jgi:hypothetical protein
MFVSQLPKGRLQQSNSKGDWCACRACAEYVKRDAWEDLIDHVCEKQAYNAPSVPYDTLRQYISSLIDSVRKHRISVQ